jgi:allantoate deiminase
MAGTLDESVLALRDQDGITLAEAVKDFGGDPTALESCRRSSDDLIGYCEVHIEQGPLLEQRDLSVGVVSAIAGQTRSEVVYKGSAGHAGTVPMALRRDALAAAAEFILAVESGGRGADQLMATVGQVTVYPGASNVIPGEVKLSLDVRHPRDEVRLSIGNELEERSRELAARRGVDVAWETVQATKSVQCDPALAGLLEEAIRQEGLPVLYLASGAGHDAAIMAGVAPTAMLFVRCRGGVSHSPLESVRVDDVRVATAVLARFLDLVGERYAA